MVVVQGATRARRWRGMTASRDSTTTGLRPMSAISHHHISPRAGMSVMRRQPLFGTKPGPPTRLVRPEGVRRRRRSWRPPRLRDGEPATQRAHRQQAQSRACGKPREPSREGWRPPWCSNVCGSCHNYATRSTEVGPAVLRSGMGTRSDPVTDRLLARSACRSASGTAWRAARDRVIPGRRGHNHPADGQYAARHASFQVSLRSSAMAVRSIQSAYSVARPAVLVGPACGGRRGPSVPGRRPQRARWSARLAGHRLRRAGPRRTRRHRAGCVRTRVHRGGSGSTSAATTSTAASGAARSSRSATNRAQRATSARGSVSRSISAMTGRSDIGTGSSSPTRAQSRASFSRAALPPTEVNTVLRLTPARAATASMVVRDHPSFDEQVAGGADDRSPRRPGLLLPKRRPVRTACARAS